MKVVNQIIEYLDDQGYMTDQLYDRLVELGCIKPAYLKGRFLSRTMMAQGGTDSVSRLPLVQA